MPEAMTVPGCTTKIVEFGVLVNVPAWNKAAPFHTYRAVALFITIGAV